MGNWLTRNQAQELISAAPRNSLRGWRDGAILGLLLRCGLRRPCFGPLRSSDCLLLSRLSGIQDVGGLHVLWADANRNHAVAGPARKCCTFQEPDNPREPSWFLAAEATPGDSFLDQRLHGLREPGGEGTTALDFGKIVGADSAFAKGSCQYIRRRDGVLNGKIDPDTADGRHSVSRIADAHQAGAMPLPQAIHSHGQQFQIVPIAELTNSVVEEGRQFDNRRAKGFDTFCLHLRDGCFWSRNAALPIVSAVGQEQGPAAIGVKEQLRVVRVPGQPHPEHICRSAQILNRQAGVVPDNGLLPSAPTTRVARTSGGPGNRP